MALSWFRSLLSRKSQARRSPRTGRVPVRPRLEILESRLAPANVTWDGGGSTNNWDDRFNWAGDSAPVTGDALIFPSAAAVSVDPTSFSNVNTFTDNRAFSAITFNGQGYEITGESIQVLGGTITSGSGSNALNIDIDFSNLTVTTSGQLTLGGVLSGGNITKTGIGRAILTNDNPDFTGLMTVNTGTIVVASDGALGASGSAANGTVVNGSTGISQARVELNGDGIDVGEEFLSLAGAAAKLANGTGSGSNSWAGLISFPDNGSTTGRGFNALAGQLTVSGVISSSSGENGPPSLDIDGAGSVVFAGDDSTAHTGTFRVTGGTLVLQKENGAQAIVGPLDVINSGTVRWAAADQISNVSIRVEQGALNLNGFNDTLGPLNLDSATITTGTGTLTLAGTLTEGVPGGPSGNSSIAGNLALGAVTSRTITVNANGNTDDLTISAVIQGSSLTALFKDGTGRLVLSGANQHSGLTSVNAGVLTITNSQALGVENTSNTSPLADGTDVRAGAALEVRGAASGLTVANEHVRIAGTGAANGGALRNVSGNNTWSGEVQFSISGGTVTSVGTDGTSTLTLASSTSGGGSTATIAKVGTGKLIFTGAGSTTASPGTFEVRQGVVNARGSATVGAATTNLVVLSGAAVELENRTATFNHAGITLNGNGIGNAGALRLINSTAIVSSPITLASDVFIGANGGATLTQTGVISGPTANDLRKVGAGTMILAVGNSYSGSTVVAGGTLTIRSATSLGTTTSGTTVQPGGTLMVDRTLTVGESLTLGIASVAGEPTLAVQGNRSETVNWNAPITLNNSATVRVNGTGVVLQLPNSITSANPAALTKKGTAQLQLTGTTSNTAFEGPLVVNEGSVVFAKTGGAQAIDGGLTIGDGVGTANSASVRLSSPEQIPSTGQVNVLRDGVLNLSNNNETFFRLNLTGGTVSTGTGTLTVSQVFSLSSADSAAINGHLRSSGQSLRVETADGDAEQDLIINAIVGSFVDKFGAGSLVLNGDNTNGGLLARDGQTFVNGSQPVGDVSVIGSSTVPELGGSGTVGRLALQNGVVNAGEEPDEAGLLTVSNGFVVQSSNLGDSVRKFEVDLRGGNVAGTDFDQLNVIGSVNLGTNLAELVINAAEEFTADGGDTFVIINNDGTNDQVTGQFIDLPEDSTVMINDEVFRISYRGANGNDNDVVLIRNSGSMFPNRSLTSVVTEGGYATLTGTISEPDAQDYFILEVNWGDGTATEKHVFEPGSDPQVTLRHRYLNNKAGQLSSQYAVTLGWHDQHNEGNSDVLSVTVRNANPTISAGGDVTLRSGQALTRSGFVLDAGVRDTHTATVDYGDGSDVVELALAADGSFQLSHRYLRRGTYTVTIWATDSDGGTGSTSFEVTV